MLGVNFVALDRDQSATGIRRGDADRDFVAAVVLRAIELDLQLGIFLERPRNRAATNHRESQLAKASILIVAQFEDVIAWIVGGKCVMKAVGGNRDLFRFRDALFQHRFVGVIAVLLFRQNGNIFLRDDVGSHVFDRDPIELRIDRDQIDRARFLHVDVTQVAVGFVADHVRQRGNERVDRAGDAAAAFASNPSAMNRIE